MFGLLLSGFYVLIKRSVSTFMASRLNMRKANCIGGEGPGYSSGRGLKNTNNKEMLK